MKFLNGQIQLDSSLTGTTALFTSGLTVGSGQTSSSGIARGQLLNSNLTASANNDVLVGIDINPTFVNGAFTGVSNVDLRTINAGVVIGSGYGYGGTYGYANDGIIQVKANGTGGSGFGYATQLWLRPSGNPSGFNSNYWSFIEQTQNGLHFQSGRYASNITLRAGRDASSGNVYFNNAFGTMAMLFGATSNMTIGTTTDAGYKLDVNGTLRVQGNTTLNGTLSIGNGSFSYSVNPNDSFTISGNQGLILNHGNGNAGGVVLGASTSPNFTVSVSNSIRNGVSISRPVTTITGTTGLTYNSLVINNVIDYTNANSSMARGLYINPTLTSVTDFRAIETTVGNVLLCTTSGNVSIGTTTDLGFKLSVSGSTLLRGSGTTSGTTAILIQSSTGGTGSVISNTGNYGINVDIPLANFHTRGLYNELYFQSPTTNSGGHDISFGFGGTGKQVRIMTEATGGGGNGNLYIAAASGDVTVATTSDANLVISTTATTLKKNVTIDNNVAGLTNPGLVISGYQVAAVTSGIYFRYSETRVAILSKPTGGGGNADFRIATVPTIGGSGNNPPQESDTKFMITHDTANTLINTTTDLGFKLSVSGSTLLRGSGTTSASYALATQNSSGGTTMVVNDAGNMLIGTTTDAGYKLDVNGTAKFTGTVSMAGGTIVANTYTVGGLSLSVTNSGHFSSRAIYASSGNIGVTGESSLGAGPNGTNSSGVYAKMPVSPIGSTFTDSDGVFNTTYKPIGLLSERAIITTGGTSSNMTNGVMLQVMGSTLLTSSVISNSIPATPNTAYGLYIKNTLVATNNNNRLIGLDIQPTFTPGSFTGLTQLALRVSGGTQIIGSGSTGTTLSVFSVDGSSGRLFDVSDDLSSTLFSVNTIAGLPVIEAFANNAVVMGKYNQNTLVVSGTSVGIGTSSPQAKLDVNGTMLLGSLSGDPSGANGMIYYNTTTNKFRGYENGAWGNLIG
jgi:hypothetical protein